MELDFTNPAILKEASDAIRIHNYIHNRAERNAVLITEYLSFAADLIDKVADGDVVVAQHGQWVVNDQNPDYVDCTNCGLSEWLGSNGSKAYAKSILKISGFKKFCPNCGAKMDGGADDG